jgi:hypothetical protein
MRKGPEGSRVHRRDSFVGWLSIWLGHRSPVSGRKNASWGLAANEGLLETGILGGKPVTESTFTQGGGAVRGWGQAGELRGKVGLSWQSVFLGSEGHDIERSRIL